MPETCDRSGCAEPVQTWCPLCERLFCLEHDKLPDGHVCLSAMIITSNVSRVLDDDEAAVAIERFRPLA